MGIIIHISGRDSEKRNRFVDLLGNTLRKQGYTAVKLLEQPIREKLASTDNELLARAIGWASELLVKTGGLVIISVSTPLSKVLTGNTQYIPAVELTIDTEPITSASEKLDLTAETINLPQEIAQVVSLVESWITASQEGSQTRQPGDDSIVYSNEEEALLEAHLRALGYL